MLKVELQQNYFKTVLNDPKTDQKKKWQLLKQFWPDKKQHNKILSINNKVDDIDKANEINNFFATVGIKLMI